VIQAPFQAVLLAAGKGTRLKSSRAKVLHRAQGVPLLEHVLRAVAGAGAERITLVVGHEADAVEAAFAGRGEFVRQDPPLGTGHALLAARERFTAQPQTTLLVVNGDLPLVRAATLARLIEQHHAGGVAATLLSVELAEPGAYGRVLRDASGNVRAIVEAKDASAAQLATREINVGAYVFAAVPLVRALERLTAHNAQGELYLTDAITLLVGDGHAVAALRGDDPSEALGVNTLEELAEASRLLNLRQLRALLAAGAVIEDPATTWIGADVVVEPEATLRAFTILEGRTVVRRGASVGPFTRALDAVIGEEAQILDHCLLRECIVEAGASVGPFAHLRPETHVGARARVGNFVELKKTRLGDGSKAPHLSYLGDAQIGPGVNVGAGTITCNYDGERKHPTTIGAGAFIGSDTTLVAPVVVGENAYVGAGSTITEDVPKDALALGRARQVVKQGWARKRKRAKQGG
jgi:bifunctional UDP-N-acetylglucosamine pyrophosphorylase/glucosamine-1-phosphate N-acetyltransferase